MNRSSSVSPTAITADRKSGLMRISWSDGHASLVPFGLLRAACPCASCRGGHAQMTPEPDPAVFQTQLPDSPATRIRSVEGVGSYAISIVWEDGHHFGIYNWHYLRALCPCPQCMEERGHDG